MAWIYSLASVDSVSHSFLGSDRSLIVKTMLMPKVYFCPECETAHFPEPQYGMTCERSMQQSSGLNQKLSMEDFPAKISALQELGKVWLASEAVFFTKSSDSLATFDQASFSWKTSQTSLFETLNQFLANSMRWGMTVAGRLFQPQNLEPVIYEKDGGSLPTVTAVNYGYNQSMSAGAKRRMSLQKMASSGKIPTPMARDFKGPGGNRNSPDLPFSMGGSLSPLFVEEIMGYDIGWTELGALEMQWFRSRRGKRSCG